MDKLFDPALLSEEDIATICKEIIESEKGAFLRNRWANHLIKEMNEAKTTEEKEMCGAILSLLGFTSPLPLTGLKEDVENKNDAFAAMLVYSTYYTLGKVLEERKEELEKRNLLNAVEREVKRMEEFIG